MRALGGREVAGIGLGRRHAKGRCYCAGRYVWVTILECPFDTGDSSIRWNSGDCCPVFAVCEMCAAWAADQVGNRDLGANTYTISGDESWTFVWWVCRWEDGVWERSREE